MDDWHWLDAREKTRRDYQERLEQKRKAKLQAEQTKRARRKFESESARLFPKL